MIVRPPDNYIVFDGRNLTEFGLHISGDKTFGGPERDVEEVEIPGRDGSLTFDNGRFKNYTLEYEASIVGKSERDFDKKINALRNFLLSRVNYKRLEDSYHPDEYRLAKVVSGFDPEVIMMQGGKFTLEFDCKPQRFLKSGEFPISIETEYSETGTGTVDPDGTIHIDETSSTRLGASVKLFNPTYFNAKPILRVYGSGSFWVNDVMITITDHDGIDYIDIDCDLKDCYYDSTNCNGYVSFTISDPDVDYPVIVPGENTITIEAGEDIAKIDIYPRWYKI